MTELVPGGSAVLIGPDGRVVAQHQAGIRKVAASTIKLPLILEVLHQAEVGELNLSQTYTVRQADVVGGSGELQRQVGAMLTLRDLARYAIVYSDNVAANVLLDHVTMDRVNARMRDDGYPNTRFERRFLDTAAQAQGRENWTTAEDLAGMLSRLWQGTLAGPKINEELLGLLKERGERDPEWLGLGLPQNAAFYHINGTLDRVRNDAGIVGVGANRAYVLVVCQDGLTNARAGEIAITELARRVHGLVMGRPIG